MRLRSYWIREAILTIAFLRIWWERGLFGREGVRSCQWILHEHHKRMEEFGSGRKEKTRSWKYESCNMCTKWAISDSVFIKLFLQILWKGALLVIKAWLGFRSVKRQRVLGIFMVLVQIRLHSRLPLSCGDLVALRLARSTPSREVWVRDQAGSSTRCPSPPRGIWVPVNFHLTSY